MPSNEYKSYEDWYDNGPGSESFKRSCVTTVSTNKRFQTREESLLRELHELRRKAFVLHQRANTIEKQLNDSGWVFPTASDPLCKRPGKEIILNE